MFSARTPYATVKPSRLDAAFYSPSHVQNAIKVHAFNGKMLEDCCTRILDHSFLSIRTEDYQKMGVPFVRVKNLKGIVLDEDFVFISEDSNQRESQTICGPGDLLFAKTGKTAAAPVPAHLPQVNTSQDVMVATVSRDIDSYYIASYLNCKHGSIYQERYVQGPVQPHLSLGSLRKLFIPLFGIKAQNYIGDKVRLAERLRAVASESEATFRNAVLDEFLSINDYAVGNVRHNRAKPHELDGDLNPGSFNPDRVKVRLYLKANGGRKISTIANIETPTTSTYSSCDCYIGLDSVGSTTGTIKPSTVGQEEVVGTVRLLSEGPVISKLRPYLNKVAYVPSMLAGACGSTELLCVRGKSSELNWYLCGVLSLHSTVRQLVPVSTGSTHPRVTREDVLDVFIPWIKSPEETGQKLAIAQRAYFTSDGLIAIAKFLLEALIERKVTDDELIDAQMKLEQGDYSADRAILSRLYEGGLDAIETRPLFHDLDAYYETLRMVEQNKADEVVK